MEKELHPKQMICTDLHIEALAYGKCKYRYHIFLIYKMREAQTLVQMVPLFKVTLKAGSQVVYCESSGGLTRYETWAGVNYAGVNYDGGYYSTSIKPEKTGKFVIEERS